ncbi:MAG: hypothetical protein U0871_23825 [Gemmataceae bacterium]
MPTRVSFAVALVLAVAASGSAQTIHRNGFAGRTTAFVRGDSSCPFQEKDHRISDEFSKTGGTSEYIKIDATPQPGATEAEFVHYFYETPPAPVTDRLLARVFVRSFKGGVQVKGRVVLPKERDPKNPDSPLTVLVSGDVYTRPRQWDGLNLGNVEDALNRQLSVLGAKLGRAVNKTDAYLDRIVLNVYAGPGTTEVWVDDLEVGPVRADAPPAAPRGGAAPPPAIPAGKGGGRLAPNGRAVEYSDGQIVVEHDDGEMRPFFMRAVRYTDTPPEFFKELRDAGFNTIWFPTTTPMPVVEEAIRQGFFVVPELPLPAAEWADGKPKRPDPKQIEADADRVGNYLRQYLAADAVLMWNLGTGRTAEDLDRVARVAGVIRRYDPRRPRAIDLWDGFSAYGSYATAIGSHRFPLFSSLELGQYRDWLNERRALTGPGKMTFTWVQDHFPDWLQAQLCGPAAPTFPTGPHPEQVRILTYLGLAAGCRGLGFWSDRALFAADPTSADCLTGRERLLEAALLNSEIEMLAPVLFQAQDPARWKETSHPHVQAAVIRGQKDIVVLPVWLGPGTQHTPPLAALPELRITVPMVPEGAVPYLITPAEVTEIHGTKRTYGGVEIAIEQFDTAAAVVFTTDLKATGILVRWQDHVRRKAREAARMAQQLAIAQYNKTLQTHAEIVKAGGPEPPEAAELFAKCRKLLADAKVYADNNQFDIAYRESRKALQPLRTIMRADWENAVRTLDYPAASPYAASVYTLPRHWELAREVAASRPAGSGLAHGGFELSRPAPEGGAAVTSLPGWKVRKLILDKVDGVAAIVNVDQKVPDRPPDPPTPFTHRYAPLRVAPRAPDFRQPEFGSHCLRLAISKPDKAAPTPLALERAVVAVDSPAAELPPGQVVRISFWARVGYVEGSADGFVAFDTAGGEPLGVRIRATAFDEVRRVNLWQKFHLYRRVPADGRIGVSFVLTGLGEALVDDVRIEPLVGGVAVGP